ncbi:MAG: SDR family NAD(P)-dependent oxidoreductase [Actinomycetota bacterium]|nr:SDR family NAD(P)-dependent oxidoreductase [Actinomycetota bacterium]
MESLQGKVAVVTGAASGIGRGMADRFAATGMKVVLADVEEGALAATTRAIVDTGAEAEAVTCDVSSRAAVDALAEVTVSRFGGVHVVCNNAGVAGGMGPLWETTSRDWEWVLGVNLLGVVHGIQAFVPLMLEQGGEGHVVNTSSVLGLSSGGGSIYSVTKHAVTRLSEGLLNDLKGQGSAIGVSVLCPGLIATQIVSSERNRPEELRDDVDEAAAAEAAQRRELMQGYFLAEGMPPAEVASIVVDAIRADRFYVLTHPDMIKPHVEERLRAVLDEGAPPVGFAVGD